MPGQSREAVLRLSVALPQSSEHPLVRVVMAAVRMQQLPVPQALDAQALSGRGLPTSVDGQVALLGSSRLMHEKGPNADPLAQEATHLEGDCRTVSWLLRDAGEHSELLGLLAFGDLINAAASEAVACLHALDIQTAMLTGDNRGSAEAVARWLGIRQFRAEVLPGDKAAVVQELRSAGQVVAMVGDGINDAPALAAVEVGIAMSSGTDATMEVAGIPLMRGDPRLVADALDVSRRSYTTLKRGLFRAFVYNVVGNALLLRR